MTPPLAAESLSQHLVLYAIRISLLLLALGLIAESAGFPRSRPRIAWLWFLGAVAANIHSFGSIAAFHHGSQQEAYDSIAEQTRDAIGVPFGAGLFVNYLFTTLWLLDALLALTVPTKHRALPPTYHWAILGFLGFIAFNGTVIFKTGWLRWTGLLIFLGIATTATWRFYNSRLRKRVSPN